MIYPASIENKLGFDTIKDLLREHCQTFLGRNFVDKLSFLSDQSRIQRLLLQCNEMKHAVDAGRVFTIPPLEVFNTLSEIKAEGSFLEAEAIIQVSDLLLAASRIASEIKSEEQELELVLRQHPIPSGLGEYLAGLFTNKGELRDDASAELARIRASQKKASVGVRKSLERIFREVSEEGFVPENSKPTFRDSRFVIPVKAAFKRQIKGFIHDASATGQTVYLEPTEVLEQNNALVELQLEEKRECIRIYRACTDRIRMEFDLVNHAVRFLGLVDFIHAKASLMRDLDATVPTVLPKPEVSLQNARHPLLHLQFRKEKKTLVPLNLSLGGGARIVLISGPNAGGKSVCLKTVGLLQYMVQCGIPIPVEEGSQAGIFSNLFVDMGDEQSIENDLSTYSSHLENMKVMLNHANEASMVLIDEFGTGTDPEFGGAIAEAILEQLIRRNVSGVITTHYGSLKEMAEHQDGITNAAMQFDLKALKPLYVLEMDKPGSSFALEVAANIGLPKRVVQQAKKIAGTDSVGVETLINQLSQKERELRDKMAEVKQMEQQLKVSLQTYQSRSAQLEEKKAAILEKARAEAQQILDTTNKQIEKTIRHIKENKAHKSETKKVRAQLEDLKLKVGKKKSPERTSENRPEFDTGDITVGDRVWNTKTALTGEVTEIRGKNAKIAVGELSSTVKLADLRKVKRVVGEKPSTRSRRPIDISKKQSQFNTQLNIRGMRAEEVHSLIEKFLDDAILLGHHELRVLHGKGTGVLREIVRNLVRTYPQVIAVEDEHADRGGAGITVIHLK